MDEDEKRRAYFEHLNRHAKPGESYITPYGMVGIGISLNAPPEPIAARHERMAEALWSANIHSGTKRRHEWWDVPGEDQDHWRMLARIADEARGDG